MKCPQCQENKGQETNIKDSNLLYFKCNNCGYITTMINYNASNKLINNNQNNEKNN